MGEIDQGRSTADVEGELRRSFDHLERLARDEDRRRVAALVRARSDVGARRRRRTVAG